MPYTITTFLTRKPGTTPQQFKTHYETVHIPLLKLKVGPLFPISHTRHYITRTPSNLSSSDTTNDNYKPTVYGGTAEDFDNDVHAVLVFASFDQFLAFASEVGEMADKDEEWKDDCGRFLDVRGRGGGMKSVAVEEAVVTLCQAPSEAQLINLA